MENTELIYYPILDLVRPKAQERAKKIQEDLGKTLKITDNIDEATAFLVGGGDGFMLDVMKKYYDFNKTPQENKLFFGVKC
jgi:NAD kinase